jgi:WD40 repeat protein/serine/threonine protein kinase
MPIEPSSAQDGATREHPVPQIPDHELLRVIGEGSYGEVWLARNIMGTYRAVKVVHRRTFETARPFEREFAGMQKFEPVSRTHDGLVDILQIGRNDQAGYFYYVMELADDAAPPPHRPAFSSAHYVPRTLGCELARRGRLPCEECLPLFLSLVGALGHLHQRELIHRDIKPSNIIFVNGVAKLADIGLVSEAGQSSSYVGTEGYIPPEGAGTPQADLFSLGKVFYELSTGKDRTEFPSLPIDAVPPAEARRLLELNAVFIKACENDIRHRYQTAEEMQADLALLRSGKSVKRLRVIERRLAQATRTGLVAAALFLLAMAAYLFTQHQARVARDNFRLAGRQRARAERAELDATEKLRDALLAQAHAGRRSGQAGQRVESFEAVRRAAAIRPGLDLRNEAIACLALADLRPLPTPPNSRSQQQYSAFDESLERFVRVNTDGAVSVCRADDGVEMVRFPDRISLGNLHSAFSPDGRFLALYHPGGGLLVWDLTSRKRILRLPHDAALLFCAFTPDSRTFAAGYTPGSLIYRDVNSGETNQSVVTGGAPQRFAFSRDGQRLAMWRGSSSRSQILDVRSGRLLYELKHPMPVLAMAWSPDGRRLAAGCLDANIHLWDADTGERQQVLPGHRGAVAEVLFLGDAHVLASISWDGTTRLWDTHTGRSLVSTAGGASSPKFNPQTRRMGCHYREWGQLELYEVALPATVRTLAESPADPGVGLTFVDFSPDGRRLVSCATNGVSLWNLTDTRLAAYLPMEMAHTVLFAPDGGSLITCAWSGLLRWPITRPAEDELQLGPPQPAAPALTRPRMFVRSSLIGGDAVFTTIHQGPIRGYRSGTNFLQLAGSERTTSIAASADGKWIAAGYWNRPNARLWDAQTGRLIRQLPTLDSTFVAFTPDSRWLVTGASDEYRFWELLTGEPGLRLPRAAAGAMWGPMAFTRDGRVMAFARSRWLVQLVETATGHELAALEQPDARSVAWLAFNPDGTQLAVATDVIHVWDLRRLREELATLNLDWDQPPFPPPQTSFSLGPIRVKTLP